MMKLRHLSQGISPCAALSVSPGIRGWGAEHALDLLAQPAIGRVVLDAFVPVHVGLDLSRFQGQRIDAIAPPGIEDLRVPLGKGQQQVGFAHHPTSHKIVLAPQNHIPAQPQPAELDVD